MTLAELSPEQRTELATRVRDALITLHVGVSIGPQSLVDLARIEGVRGALRYYSRVPPAWKHLALFRDTEMVRAHGWLRGVTDVLLGFNKDLGDLFDVLGVSDAYP